MTELRPLLESSDDELERALLQSVRMDVPGPAGLREAALALGLAASTANALAATLPAVSSLGTAVGVPGTAVVGPASVSGGAMTSGTAVASTASASGALGVVSLGVLGKSLLAGALVSFVALTTLDQTRDVSTQSSVPVVPTNLPAATVSRPMGDESTPPAFVPPLGAPADPQPAAARATPRSNRRSSVVAGPAAVVAARPLAAAPANTAFAVEPHPQPAPVGTATNASLATEIRTLDQARSALAAGDSKRATQLLDAYAANRPSATLSQEAALLRVRLLLSRGQRPAAAELARRIIAQYPESTHVDSLRRLAAEP